MAMDKGKVILVAGKSGQLARALTELAARRGVPLIAIGRPNLDIEDPRSIEAVAGTLQPRLIVNAAAYTAVDRAEVERERAFSVNRDGAARLAAAAAKLGISHIHVSTDYVFDGRKSVPYCEDDMPYPLNVYGQSKLDGERAVRDALPSALVLRSSWVYSPWGHNFVTTMLRLADTREIVQVVDDQRGAPTAAIDLAGAILDIAEQVTGNAFAGHCGTYHLTASGETTWHGFAQAIFACLARQGRRVPALAPVTTADYPTVARRPADSRLDCAKIAGDFGIRMPHWRPSLDACLDDLASARMEI
jgi:dTDP-4-dehydrorhamnose reductase